MWNCESGCREVRKEVTWASYDLESWGLSRVHRRQANPISLVGGFSTILCAECEQTWHEFIFPTDAFKGLRKAQNDCTRLEISGYGKAEFSDEATYEKRYDEIKDKIEAAKQVLFGIAKEWSAKRKEEQTRIGFELEKKFKAEEKERQKQHEEELAEKRKK